MKFLGGDLLRSALLPLFTTLRYDTQHIFQLYFQWPRNLADWMKLTCKRILSSVYLDWMFSN